MPAKLLIVEDNLDTRTMMHLHFTMEGFTVVVAANGVEGIYMASVEKPDLIITDINMPDMNGIEMTRQLKTRDDTKAIPILALTAFSDQTIDEVIKAGADRAINKPVPIDELVEDVNELLNQSRQK